MTPAYRTRHQLILFAAVVATLGALMPIAERGVLFLSISHIGGLSVALYLTGPLIALFALLSLTGKMHATRIWYLPPAIFSLALSVLISFGVAESLDQRPSLRDASPASFGLGAYALMLGHAVVTFAAIGLKAARAPADDQT